MVGPFLDLLRIGVIICRFWLGLCFLSSSNVDFLKFSGLLTFFVRIGVAELQLCGLQLTLHERLITIAHLLGHIDVGFIDNLLTLFNKTVLKRLPSLEVIIFE